MYVHRHTRRLFFEAGYDNIAEAMAELSLVAIELAVDRNVRIPAAKGSLGRPRLSVADERFGLTLDAANFYWAGYPLSRIYELVEQFVPRTRHVHCKNIDYPLRCLLHEEADYLTDLVATSNLGCIR